MVWIRQAEV